MGAVVVSIPLVTILALLAIGQFGDRLFAAQAAPACGDKIMQDQIRAAMFAGLDDAFRQKVASIYTVWLSDGRGQPARAKAGVDLAIGGYLHGYKAIETWSLPSC